MESKVNMVFAKVQRRFIQRLAALFRRYSNFITLLEAGKAAQSDIEEVYMQVHRTAGTAKAFEFHQLSDQSLALEKHLEELSEGKEITKNTQAILDGFGDYLKEIKCLVNEHLGIELDTKS